MVLKRILADLMDLILIGVISSILLWIGSIIGIWGSEHISQVYQPLDRFIWVVVAAVYSISLMSRSRYMGMTLGKQLFKLKVEIDPDARIKTNEKTWLSTFHIFTREVIGKWLPFNLFLLYSSLWLLGIWWLICALSVFFKRGPHDLISQTHVVAEIKEKS